MELQANENVCEEAGNGVDATQGVGDTSAEAKEPVNSASSEKNIRSKGKNYGKKFSARLYKYFSLWTFFIYYFNFMVRIGMRCSDYYKVNGITKFSLWWAVMTDTSKWGEICHAVFDWYTITLLVFLFLYAAVFLITFIRFSPRNKKTFKYFKKGFVMARRVIKLISVGLTLTVLVNSAKLATFSDKFMFVISLLSILFTLMQIFVSVTTWIIGRKLNRSVKQYVGNVMSNYIATARVRPQRISSNKVIATVGDKLGKAKDRFLRTIETLTLTNDEAMRRAAELEGSAVDTKDMTERFENDYQPQANEEEVQVEEQKEKVKKTKLNVRRDKRLLTKKEKQIVQKRVKVGKFGKAQESTAQDKDIAEQVASDVAQDVDCALDGEKDESTT
ncbi:MAG: hypothetical protein K2M75_04895 [Clostridia bacterium]|nr:hypothetical protein [Clostridia bacterium]